MSGKTNCSCILVFCGQPIPHKPDCPYRVVIKR